MEPAYKSLNLSEFFDKKNSLLMFFYSFCIIRLNGPITEKGTIPLQELRPIIEDHGC